jgi:uncharacterized Zn finger protein (UPF0148 family)
MQGLPPQILPSRSVGQPNNSNGHGHAPSHPRPSPVAHSLHLRTQTRADAFLPRPEGATRAARACSRGPWPTTACVAWPHQSAPPGPQLPHVSSSLVPLYQRMKRVRNPTSNTAAIVVSLKTFSLDSETTEAMAPTASASMGELLLGGWTMLAEGCEQCHVPLMRNPNGQEDVCVGCGRRTSTSLSLEVEAAVPQSPDVGDRECIGVVEAHEEGAALDGSAGVRASPGAEVPGRPGSPASMLADKMLEGWRMLADHCPICRTPLCESKGGQMRCVSCDLEVRREGPGKQELKRGEEAGFGDNGDQARDHHNLHDRGDGHDGGEGLELRRTLVMGRVLRYMEELSGALLGAPPSASGDEDALIRRLERCADIVLKLGSIPIK